MLNKTQKLNIREVEGKRLLNWLETSYDISINNKALMPAPFSYDEIRKELEFRLNKQDHFKKK